MAGPQREAIRRELKSLFNTNGGRATAVMVVERARDPDSPLHSCFEWDDTAAANAYRIEQARCLIRSVKIEISNTHTNVTSVAYVRDPRVDDGAQGYVAISAIRSDAEAKRDVLVQEFSRAASALRRARSLAAAFDMVDDVETIIEQVEAAVFHVQSGQLPQ